MGDSPYLDKNEIGLARGQCKFWVRWFWIDAIIICGLSGYSVFSPNSWLVGGLLLFGFYQLGRDIRKVEFYGGAIKRSLVFSLTNPVGNRWDWRKNIK